MKHRKTGRQFGRVRSQRKALMHGLLSNLLIHGRIETTEAKAKEVKSAVDKVITKAKRANGSAMEMTRKLQNDISTQAVEIIVKNIDKFDARVSGYARVVKLAPRKSDSARMAIVEMVDLVGKTEVKKESVKKESKKDEVAEKAAA